MSAASRLAKADSCFEKSAPEVEQPRGDDGKFLAKPPPPEFVCPECGHEYWWSGTRCSGLWDARGIDGFIDHEPVQVVPIEVTTS